MERELIYKNVGIAGLGAAGGLCSVLLSKNPCVITTGFDIKEPFETLIRTGGGRCNITNSQTDVREFVKNYPRGEKFLLSVFSKFDQIKTRKLFEDLGINTYVQQDGRVFPVSDSSKKTKEILTSHLNTSNFKWKQEKVLSVKKESEIFVVQTEKSVYKFDNFIIATGGSSSSFKLAKQLGHNIIEPKPSLCAIDILQKEFYELSGLSFKNVEIKISIAGKKLPVQTGDMLFTHNSISGPVIFKISAICAYYNMPFQITVRLIDATENEIETEIKNNSKKSIKNVISKFVPESFIQVILKRNGIDGNKQAAQIKKIEKTAIINSLISLNLDCIQRIRGSEIVTAGGVDLNEIDSKTMESKLVKGLYIIGEGLNIDGFTGGFNLQNSWSGAYLAASAFS